MDIVYKDNEITTRELVNYFTQLYGRKFNGSRFILQNIIAWIRNGKIPEAYGGYTILHKEKRKGSSHTVVTLGDSFSREDMEYIKEIKLQLPELPKEGNKPRRTKLYYQLLKKPIPDSRYLLPDNWKALGIKDNQLVSRKRKKKQIA